MSAAQRDSSPWETARETRSSNGRLKLVGELRKEKEFALRAAIAALNEFCTELASPDPCELCYVLPFRFKKSWADVYGMGECCWGSNIGAAVRFLMDESLAEQRDQSEKYFRPPLVQREVLTVMPLMIDSSVRFSVDAILSLGGAA